MLAHFIVHYAKEYGVGRFSCCHCKQTSARRESMRIHCLRNHDNVDEAEAFTDNITVNEFNAAQKKKTSFSVISNRFRYSPITCCIQVAKFHLEHDARAMETSKCI